MFDMRYNKTGIVTAPRLIIFALAAGSLTAAIQVSPCYAGNEALPKAETIIEKNIEVTGGRAAYEKIHSRVTKGTLSIPGLGAPAKMETFAAAPTMQYTLIESAGLGKIEQGTDGKTVWENSTMGGPQVKEGAERTFMLRAALFHNTTQWKDLYKSVKCVGIEEIDGKPCYKVVMQPTEGEPEIVFYDKASFMVARTETEMESVMGKLSVVVVSSDFKRVDGILIPHKIMQEIVGLQKIETIVESIDHNTKISPNRFKLPEEIQELVDLMKPSEEKSVKEKKAPTS